MFKGITAIMYKEGIHIFRDPRTLFLMLLVPGIQLTIFGYAIELDVRNIATVVYDLDGREAARTLIDSFTNSGTFHIIDQVQSDAAFTNAIVAGRAQVAIKIPPDYSDRVLRGEPVSFQALIDGSNSTIAMQALNVTNAIALRKSVSVLSQTTGTGRPPIEARPRVMFNPDMKTANFMVPGLVAIVMQVVTMFLTAFAVVREKENGTLEQIMATPVSRLGLMLGKLVPYGFIGAFETGMVLFIMRFLFGVPIAGSLLLLAAFSLIFLFTALGLGLLISAISQTQMQAVQFAFVIVLPSVLLSGFMFPQESMPYPIYVIGQFIPATYFIRLLRGVILRGAELSDLWQTAAILAGMGFVILMISATRFRKTLA